MVSKGLNARTIEEFDVDALIYAEVVVVTIFRHVLHELLTNLIV